MQFFLEAVDAFDLPAKVAVTEDLGLVPVEQEVGVSLEL